MPTTEFYQEIGAEEAPLSLVPALVEVRRAYDFFNVRFFGNALVPPVFAFHPQPPNGRSPGQFLPVDGERPATIALYADLCAARGRGAVYETLLCQMIHQWQYTRGSPGASRHYRNKQWRAEAARVGLICDSQGGTTPGPGFLTALDTLAPAEMALPQRDPLRRQHGRMLRWSCPCGMIIRVARQDLDATCNRCGGPFLRS